MTNRITLQTGSDTLPFELQSEYFGADLNPDIFGFHSPPFSMLFMFDESITATEQTESSFTLKTSKSNFIITEKGVKSLI